MNNPGLNTYQYPQKYDLSTKDGKNGAVNIYINGVNTPQPPIAQYPCLMPPTSYVYYVPYNFQQNNNNQQNNTCVSSQNLDKKTKISTKTEKKEEKKSKKPVTQITDQLLTGLNQGLLHGDKQTRMHSVARVINLLREDDPSRKNDPRFIDLINNALHPNQPQIVRTTALSAVHNDAVKGDEITRQYLTEMAGKNDKNGDSGLAAITLSQLSPPGQRLNVISQ